MARKEKNGYWGKREFANGAVRIGNMKRHVSRSYYTPHHGKNVAYFTDDSGNIKRLKGVSPGEVAHRLV